MRILLLALALVSPALAAQPLAPEDSVLVERLLEVSGVLQSADMTADQFASAPLPAPLADSLLAAFAPQAIVDSVRAAFVRNYDRDNTVAAIEVLTDPVFRPLLDIQESMASAEAGEEMVSVLANPSAYDLADSLTVARLVSSTGMAETSYESSRKMMIAMMSAMPSGAQEAAFGGKSVEEQVDSMLGAQFEGFQSTMITSSRYAYRDVPPEAVTRLADFYASPAGQYLLTVSHAGTEAGMEPLYGRLAQLFEVMFDASGGGQ